MGALFDDWYDYVNPYRYGQAATRGLKSVGDAASDYFRGPSRAANAQASAAQSGLESQERMFDKSLATQKPWLEVGEKHLRSLSDMVGGDGFGVDPGRFAPREFKFNFQADPGYQFRQDEGRRMVEGSVAASGGLRSGATLKALSDYASGMASDEYGRAYGRAYSKYSDAYARDYGIFSDDYNRRVNQQSTRYNQLANMAGLGQTAAGNVSGMSMQQGQNLASAYNNIGNAQANRSMAMQNTFNPLLNAAAQGAGAYYGAR